MQGAKEPKPQGVRFIQNVVFKNIFQTAGHNGAPRKSWAKLGNGTLFTSVLNNLQEGGDFLII